MVVTHSSKNEAGKGTLRFLVLALTFFLVFFIIPAFPIQNIHAAEITLAWDRNSEPDIAGYRVYYGRESRSYTNVVDVGNYTSCVIADLEDGKAYYFAATAYNTDGYESGYSNEVNNGNGGAASGGSSGGGSACFIDTAACGFPMAHLIKSTQYSLSKIKRIMQRIFSVTGRNIDDNFYCSYHQKGMEVFITFLIP
jgi:hypothetical protein